MIYGIKRIVSQYRKYVNALAISDASLILRSFQWKTLRNTTQEIKIYPCLEHAAPGKIIK